MPLAELRGGDGGLRMRDPLLRRFSGSISSSDSSTDSWLYRVRENLAQLLLPSHFKPSSANGAPIHLLKFEKSPRPARAQGASLLTHIAIFAAIAFLLTHTRDRFKDAAPVTPGTEGPITISSTIIRTLTGPRPSDGGSRGGGNNPVPASHGGPPPPSPIQLVKPTIPPSQTAVLPEPPTIPDANAAVAGGLGLQWMIKDTNSAGPGKGHGIGSTDGNDMGDHGPGFYGNGQSLGPYGPGFIAPVCAYCPYPTYSDDARKAKVQGAVTLQVLVGADGRAQDIRIVRGIGFGLDERAMETVRGWKFIPARDGAKHNVPAWVTVEAVFRLF